MGLLAGEWVQDEIYGRAYLTMKPPCGVRKDRCCGNDFHDDNNDNDQVSASMGVYGAFECPLHVSSVLEYNGCDIYLGTREYLFYLLNANSFHLP